MAGAEDDGVDSLCADAARVEVVVDETEGPLRLHTGQETKREPLLGLSCAAGDGRRGTLRDDARDQGFAGIAPAGGVSLVSGGRGKAICAAAWRERAAGGDREPRRDLRGRRETRSEPKTCCDFAPPPIQDIYARAMNAGVPSARVRGEIARSRPPRTK